MIIESSSTSKPDTEPTGPIPACDCGWLTRIHSTECARYIWEHRNCLPGEVGYRAAENGVGDD